MKLTETDTVAQKALAACCEYARLMVEIEKNRKDIGAGLGDCDRIFSDEWGVAYIPDGKKTHLAESFESYDEDDGCGYPVKTYNSPEEISEIIGDCEGCKKAYEAVQARKANKKKLAAIKRTIRLIGRRAA